MSNCGRCYDSVEPIEIQWIDGSIRMIVPKLCHTCMDREELAINRLVVRKSNFHDSEINHIPREYCGRGLAAFNLNDHNKGAYFAASKFMANTTTGLMIFGPTGIGKSHLCWGIIQQAIPMGMQSIGVNLGEMMERLQREATESKKEDNYLKLLRKIDLLLIDDLGSGKLSDFRCESLFSIINHRFTEKKKTLFTSNFDKKTLYSYFCSAEIFEPETFARRMISRLIGGCEWVAISGDDKRIKK